MPAAVSSENMYSTTVQSSVPCDGCRPGEVLVAGEDAGRLAVVVVELADHRVDASRSSAPELAEPHGRLLEAHAGVDAVRGQVDLVTGRLRGQAEFVEMLALSRIPGSGSSAPVVVARPRVRDRRASTGSPPGPPTLWAVVPPRRLHRDNLGTSSRAVVRFYNSRGTAEQWIKEGKQAVKMTRLSAIASAPTRCGCG